MRLGISSYTYVWAVGVPSYPTLPKPMSTQSSSCGRLRRPRSPNRSPRKMPGQDPASAISANLY